MNRVAIFAHYDKNNTIQDYVIYYLKELKKVADTIIFVSDSDIKVNELKKLNNYVTKSIVGKHGEYDFGSYKKGFFFAKEHSYLKNCDELILCNDSCYGPLFSFQKMFKKMSPQALDFWGVTENSVGMTFEDNQIKYEQPIKHIQSYFMVFKPQIIHSKIFENFISSIKQEKNRFFVVINYEEGLSTLLTQNQFKYDVYCQSSKHQNNAFLLNYEDLIIIDKNPLVKTSIYRGKYKHKFFINYEIIKNNTNYDIKLIKKDVKKNKLPMTFKHFLGDIFSIYNFNSYKILVFCGITFKFKRKNIKNL